MAKQKTKKAAAKKVSAKKGVRETTRRVPAASTVREDRPEDEVSNDQGNASSSQQQTYGGNQATPVTQRGQ